MKMKRLLCFVLCLMLAVPAAFAETADTLPKLFARQMTGGNGVRGYISLNASGIAEWLNILLPFTATDIQIRAIGEKQGDVSDTVEDDDDWQIKLYAKDSAGKEKASTWVYGDPQGIYFQSELLPGTRLKMPVEQVNLLYQLFRGEFKDLFFAFDLLDMKAPGKNGNVAAYEAVSEIFDISEEEWTNKWYPVLEKYFLHLDLWLASYGDPAFVVGDTGALTMSASYYIPSEDLKEEAKKIIGMMLYDNDLQTLLIPHVSMEQRITYLNPQMVYFYEACIDALDLKGDISFTREMSALGEVMNTSVSMPLPVLPDTLTAPVGELAAALFELPYQDILSGMERITLTKAGKDSTIVLSGEKRTVHISCTEEESQDQGVNGKGTVRVTPNAGVNENAISAAFTYSDHHRIWQDEHYLDRDTHSMSFAVEPALDMLGADDPFRNSYVDFQPVGLTFSVDYRCDPYKENSAVQVNVDVNAKLPDAEITAAAILRVTTQLKMTALSNTGAEDYTKLTAEKKKELLLAFVENAADVMSNLNSDDFTEPAAEATPTAVPPMDE